MKYLITDYISGEGKDDYKSLGLYCYSLRHNEQNWNEIESIENHVLADLYGSIITTEKLKLSNTYPNNSIIFSDFAKENERVEKIEELNNSLKDYGIIDLSSDDNIDDEFYSMFESCENFEELDKMSPKEKRKFIIEHYEQVNDYKLISKGGRVYELIHIDTNLKRNSELDIDRVK